MARTTRRTALPIFLALVACSGGGGASFTRSADVMATHYYLRNTTWVGWPVGEPHTLPNQVCTMAIDGTANPGAFHCRISKTGGSSMQGLLYAGGQEVEAIVPGSGLRGTMSADHVTMTATVAIDGQEIAVEMLDLSADKSWRATLDTYEMPGLVLFIEQVAR